MASKTTKRPIIKRRIRRRLVKPGAYNLHDDFYFTYPLPEAPLTQTFIKAIISKSLRHAAEIHPHFNPDLVREEKTVFDLGHAIERVFNNDEKHLAIAPADIRNWRGDNSAWRDVKRSLGLTPILLKQYREVERIVEDLRSQISGIDELAIAYKSGQAEITIVWRERGVWCVGKLDWLPGVGIVFPDLKSITGSAHPDNAQRQIYNLQFDIQAAFYRRGIRAVFGIREPEFRFVFVETKPPHAVSDIALTPEALAGADADIDYALDMWRLALDGGSFPGYPAQPCYVEPPAWADHQRTEAREFRRITGSARLFKLMLDWQAPL